MSTFYAKTLLIRGTKSNVRRFFAEACNAKRSKKGLLTLKAEWIPVKGTCHGYILPLIENIKYLGTENAVFSVHYKQDMDILAEDFKNLSKKYNLDFRLFALVLSMRYARNMEVVNGNITLNEFLMLGDDTPFEWYPDINFGDTGMNTERTFDITCDFSYEISEKNLKIIKTVAEEQQKRYIDKCPCCGHDEMLTLGNKTDGFPASHYGLYVCIGCGILENDKINTSLPYWYIFKDNNIDMFLPKEENNGEG